MNDYKFKMFSEDAVIHKVMYSANLYELSFRTISQNNDAREVKRVIYLVNCLNYYI